MTYDQAIRFYGIDKPDLRLPAMADASDAFTAEDKQSLAIDPAMPILAIRIPSVGELSRKERDDLKLLVPEKSKNTIKIFEDFKRVERNLPAAAEKIRRLAEAQPNDLIVIAAAPADPQAPAARAGRSRRRAQAGAPRRRGLRRRRPASPRARAKVRRPSRPLRAEMFPLPLGHRFPDVRVG